MSRNQLIRELTNHGALLIEIANMLELPKTGRFSDILDALKKLKMRAETVKAESAP
ncbi:MAG: hypothetical protein WC551_10695 [Patescibacteria group bacterium]|jgi:hypothetical protein